MSMTAAELFEVVKDVPREAWPKDLGWHGLGRWTNGDSEWYMTEAHAELAFIGSMTAWLLDRGVFASKRFNENAFWTIDTNDTSKRSGNFGTLVAALAAACKEAA